MCGPRHGRYCILSSSASSVGLQGNLWFLESSELEHCLFFGCSWDAAPFFQAGPSFHLCFDRSCFDQFPEAALLRSASSMVLSTSNHFRFCSACLAYPWEDRLCGMFEKDARFGRLSLCEFAQYGDAKLTSYALSRHACNASHALLTSEGRVSSSSSSGSSSSGSSRSSSTLKWQLAKGYRGGDHRRNGLQPV